MQCRLVSFLTLARLCYARRPADIDRRLLQKTSSGLIMPVSGGKGMTDALIGEVLAVGEDVKLEVAKGDVVIFSKCVSCAMLTIL